MVAHVTASLAAVAMLMMQQSPSKPSPPAAVRGATVKSAPKLDLTPYLLDKSQFTPDDRGRYEGSEQFDRQKARFGGAIAYQAGIVTVGDNRWMPAGAYVKYHVWKADSVDEARKAFARSAIPERKTRFARRTERRLRAGDEARDIRRVGIPLVAACRRQSVHGAYRLHVRSRRRPR